LIFTKTPLAGAYVIEPERMSDARGFFARIWCQKELRRLGLSVDIAQANVGFSRRRGTVRGLHYQRPPHAEVKIVRCTRGAMFDVMVDLRPDSPSYQQWFGAELTEENRKMFYVPEGVATGYMTLVDDTEMTYHTSEFFSPEDASGVRFDDPAFSIAWPLAPTVLSDQDRNWPLMMAAANQEGVRA
jgi:dTDP-4-dehydrorhamnose 3,5-epimerase